MKQITRKILILIHLLGIYSNLKAWSEDDLLKKIRLMNLDTALMKKVLYPYYQLTFINNLNPALGLISNDEGYTLGIHHRLRIVQNSRQRFYDV